MRQFSKFGLKKLKSNLQLRQKIAALEGKSIRSVDHWVQHNARDLTLVDILDLISTETGIGWSELLEQKKPTRKKQTA